LVRARTNAAVIARLGLGSLDSPSHQEKERDDRDLQDQEQPDEGPRIHV
jgi:hypothetical protein